MNIEKIKQIISNMEKEISCLKKEIENQEIENQEIENQEIENQEDYIFNLIQSDEWPNAVDPEMIANSEEDKIERAENILSFVIDEDLTNKKFLDFGCGEGHVAVEAQKEATISIGYDIKHYDNWNNDVLTTDFEKVKENGPYDIILLFDVLDHCKDPVEALKQICSVGYPGTIVYVRCHPWVSRHGGHLYKQLNKAYAHLFLNNDQLNKFNIKNKEYTLKINTPLNTYSGWFNQYFKIEELNEQKQQIENFFKNNKILNQKLKKIYNTKKFPWQYDVLYIDYILKIK